MISAEFILPLNVQNTCRQTVLELTPFREKMTPKLPKRLQAEGFEHFIETLRCIQMHTDVLKIPAGRCF